MATEKAASSSGSDSDDLTLDDALIDDDSMLGDEDNHSGAGSSLEDSSSIDLSPSTSPAAVIERSPVKPPPVIKRSPEKPAAVIKRSPEKKLEAVKRPASSPATKTVGQKNGSGDVSSGSPPAKKKIVSIESPQIVLPENKKIILNPQPKLPATPEAGEEIKDDKRKVIKIKAAVAPSEDKAKLREVKFGAASKADTVKGKKVDASAMDSKSNPSADEKMKKRAERFGPKAVPDLAVQPIIDSVPSAKISITTEHEVKMAKRKERFGADGATIIKGVAASKTSTTPTKISEISPICITAVVEDTEDEKKSSTA